MSARIPLIPPLKHLHIHLRGDCPLYTVRVFLEG